MEAINKKKIFFSQFESVAEYKDYFQLDPTLEPK